MQSISFEKVKSTKEHSNILFELLSKRRYSISHSTLPSNSDHWSFVRNHPYREWYIIRSNNDAIGSVYLTYTNSFSIDLIPEKLDFIESVLNWVTKSFDPLPSKKSLIPDYLYLNVPYGNKDLITKLKKVNWEPIQTSFKKS